MDSIILDEDGLYKNGSYLTPGCLTVRCEIQATWLLGLYEVLKMYARKQMSRSTGWVQSILYRGKGIFVLKVMS